MSDVASLITKISERREHLDQTFFNDLRELRQQHGDCAVDQALATFAGAARRRRGYEAAEEKTRARAATFQTGLAPIKIMPPARARAPTASQNYSGSSVFQIDGCCASAMMRGRP